MGLRIYNTLTQKIENFEPIEPEKVKMYVCGPTVYDYLHVGNFRGPIFFNLVRNWLEEIGYKVTYVFNYTDIDDKIIKRANNEGVTSKEIADKYIEEFEKDYSNIGLRKHDYNPRVSDHLEGIIKMIQTLIDNKKAYVADDGEVIYSVPSFGDYGKLSKKDLEKLSSGIRVEVSDKKHNPLDFTLWKPAKPGEPSWPSPWGDGRPGWHIECSVMSTEILGETLDIHGGGVDLIFPHHENEIAQSEGATNKPFCKYWMHNAFINMGSEKMSKSLGNIKTGRAFLEEYNAEIFKYMILASHYRSQSDFSKEVIEHAVSGLARIYSALSRAEKILKTEGEIQLDNDYQKKLDESSEKVKSALNDDFSTPEVFAQIFERVREFNTMYKLGHKITPIVRGRAQQFSKWINNYGRLMSLFTESPSEFLIQLDDMLLRQKNVERSEVDQLVEERTKARESKNFDQADIIRDKLVNLGIEVQDTPEGTFWEVAK